MLGDGCCGKTSVIMRFNNTYSGYTDPTVFDDYNLEVLIQDKSYLLNVADTSGQEDYDRLRPLSYPRTDIILIFFSVAALHSFENVKSKWYPDLRKYKLNSPIILVGTKIDLRDDKDTLAKIGNKIITTAQGQQLAKQIGAVKYLECSNVTGQGVQEIFESVVSCLEQHNLKPSNENEARSFSLFNFLTRTTGTFTHKRVGPQVEDEPDPKLKSLSSPYDSL